MTTIAFDGKTIAGDSRITYNDNEIAGDYDTKVWRISSGGIISGRIFGFAGARSMRDAVHSWIKNGCKKEDHPKEGDWSALVFKGSEDYHNDGYCLHYTNATPYGALVQAPFAIGSGDKYAVAAMHCGKTAAEAVSIAAKLDPFTGGEVISLP